MFFGSRPSETPVPRMASNMSGNTTEEYSCDRERPNARRSRPRSAAIASTCFMRRRRFASSMRYLARRAGSTRLRASTPRSGRRGSGRPAPGRGASGRGSPRSTVTCVVWPATRTCPTARPPLDAGRWYRRISLPLDADGIAAKAAFQIGRHAPRDEAAVRDQRDLVDSSARPRRHRSSRGEACNPPRSPR